MVKKMLILFSVFLNIGFLIITGYTIVHHKGFMDKKHRSGMMHIRLFQKLNLSTQQDEIIQNLVSTYMAEMDGVRKRSFHEKSALFKTLASKDVINDQVVDSRLKAINKLEVEREDVKYNHLKKIQKNLTNSQAELFFNLLIKHTTKRYTSSAQRINES